LRHTSQQQRLREFFNRSHHRKSSVTNNQWRKHNKIV
jgi:hypothetical protein